MRIFNPDEPECFIRVKVPAREHVFAGSEHGIIEQIYLSDDEPTFDIEPSLDAVALALWRMEG